MIQEIDGARLARGSYKKEDEHGLFYKSPIIRNLCPFDLF